MKVDQYNWNGMFYIDEDFPAENPLKYLYINGKLITLELVPIAAGIGITDGRDIDVPVRRRRTDGTIEIYYVKALNTKLLAHCGLTYTTQSNWVPTDLVRFGTEGRYNGYWHLLGTQLFEKLVPNYLEWQPERIYVCAQMARRLKKAAENYSDSRLGKILKHKINAVHKHTIRKKRKRKSRPSGKIMGFKQAIGKRVRRIVLGVDYPREVKESLFRGEIFDFVNRTCIPIEYLEKMGYSTVDPEIFAQSRGAHFTRV